MAAEPKRALRSSSLTEARARSFVHLILFKEMVVFRSWFTSASCFRKAWHFLWCCVSLLADKAVNLSAQYLHENMIRIRVQVCHGDLNKVWIVAEFDRDGVMSRDGVINSWHAERYKFGSPHLPGRNNKREVIRSGVPRYRYSGT